VSELRRVRIEQCTSVGKCVSVKMWSMRNEIAVKFYAELERFPRDTPENLTANSRDGTSEEYVKAYLRHVSWVAFAYRRRRRRCAFCRFYFLSLLLAEVSSARKVHSRMICGRGVKLARQS